MKTEETEVNPVWIANNKTRKTGKVASFEMIIQNGKNVNLRQVLFLLSIKYIN